MWQKVIRAGNSKAVTIPADFVRAVGVKPGDRVRSETHPESGKLTYTFWGARQLALRLK